MPPYTSAPPPPGMPPRKGTSPLVWVLVAVGAIVLLIILALGGSAYYVMHKMRQAGVSKDLMQRNPALATARLMAALNPGIEVLGADENRQILTVRDKRSGKVYSVNFEDAKKGKFVFSEDGKNVVVTASGQGPNGSIDIKSSDGGSVKFGGGTAADIPSWVPQYPGSKPENSYSATQQNESGGMFHFNIKDSVDSVMKFYEEQIRASGLRVTNSTTSHGTAGVAGVIGAEGDGGKQMSVMVAEDKGESGVTVTYSTKK